MPVRVNYQINDKLHSLDCENAEEANALIRNVFTAKLSGRQTFQLSPTSFVDLPALCWMEVAK